MSQINCSKSQINQSEENEENQHNQKQLKQISEYTQNYIFQLGQFLSFKDSVKNNFSLLQEAGFHIKIFEDIMQFTNDLQIIEQNHSPNSKIINLKIDYGSYVKSIQILNLSQSNDLHQCQELKQKSCSFGEVYTFQDKNVQYAVKCIKFQKKHQKTSWREIKDELYFILKEYFLIQLLSALKVGPRIQKIYGFDIVIFDDCFQYSMEACVQVNQQTLNVQQLQQQLKIMHAFHVVHRDIKPQNIMFSPCYNKLVFIDFGLSIMIQQNIGFKTKTSFTGTLEFCGRQMKNLFLTGHQQLIDLYYNDLQSLEVTINYLEKYRYQIMRRKKQLKCTQNILSFKTCNFYFYLCNFQKDLNFKKLKQMLQEPKIKDRIVQVLQEIEPDENLYRFFLQNLNLLDQKKIQNRLNYNPFIQKNVSFIKNSSFRYQKLKREEIYLNQMKSNKKRNSKQLQYDKRMKKINLINYLFQNLNKKLWIQQKYVFQKCISTLSQLLSFRQNQFRTTIFLKKQIIKRFNEFLCIELQGKTTLQILTKTYKTLAEICLHILFEDYSNQNFNSSLNFLKDLPETKNKKKIVLIFLKMQQESILLKKIYPENLRYFNRKIPEIVHFYNDKTQFVDILWRFTYLYQLLCYFNIFTIGIKETDIFFDHSHLEIFLQLKEKLKKQQNTRTLHQLFQICIFLSDKQPIFIMKNQELVQTLKKIKHLVSQWNDVFLIKFQHLIFFLESTLYVEKDINYYNCMKLLQKRLKAQPLIRETVNSCIIILITCYFNCGNYLKIQPLFEKIDQIINYIPISYQINLSCRVGIAFIQNDQKMLKNILALASDEFNQEFRYPSFWYKIIEGYEHSIQILQNNKHFLINNFLEIFLYDMQKIILEKYNQIQNKLENHELDLNQIVFEIQRLLNWYKFKQTQKKYNPNFMNKIQNIIQKQKENISKNFYISSKVMIYRIQNLKEKFINLFFSQITQNLSLNKKIDYMLYIEYLFIFDQIPQLNHKIQKKSKFALLAKQISFSQTSVYLSFKSLIHFTYYSIKETANRFQFLFKLTMYFSQKPNKKNFFWFLSQIKDIVSIDHCNKKKCSSCKKIYLTTKKQIQQFFSYLKFQKFDKFKQIWKNHYFSIVLIEMTTLIEDCKQLDFNASKYITKTIDYLVPCAKHYILSQYYRYIKSANSVSKRKLRQLQRKNFNYKCNESLLKNFMPKQSNINNKMIQMLKIKAKRIISLNQINDFSQFVRKHFLVRDQSML